MLGVSPTHTAALGHVLAPGLQAWMKERGEMASLVACSTLCLAESGALLA